MSSQVWAGGRCTCPGSTGNSLIWFCNLLKNAIGWRQGGQERESKRKGWDGGRGREGGSRERGYMYTYSWFLLLYGRNQQHCKAAMRVCMLSCSIVSASLRPPWAVAHQAPLSMRFSRQEYWCGLPCPSPGKRTLICLQSSGLRLHDLRVGWGRACPSNPFKFFPSWSPS